MRNQSRMQYWVAKEARDCYQVQTTARANAVVTDSLFRRVEINGPAQPSFERQLWRGDSKAGGRGWYGQGRRRMQKKTDASIRMWKRELQESNRVSKSLREDAT